MVGCLLKLLGCLRGGCLPGQCRRAYDGSDSPAPGRSSLSGRLDDDSLWLNTNNVESESTASSSSLSSLLLSPSDAEHDLWGAVAPPALSSLTSLRVVNGLEALLEDIHLDALDSASAVDSVVFEGIWRGAKVSAKFMLLRDAAPGADLRAALNLLLSQDLSHPYLLQYFFARGLYLSHTWHPATSSSTPFASEPRTRGAAAAAPSPPTACPLHVAPWNHGSLPTLADLMDLPSSQLDSGLLGTEALEVVDISATSRSMLAGGEAVAAVMDRLRPRRGDFLILLVSELCILGDLRRAVRGRCFAERPRWSAHLGLRAALCTAREVALGMQHLHGVGGHHGNLTAPNVLLLESHTDRRGFVAKVADAGLCARRPRRHWTSLPAGASSYSSARFAETQPPVGPQSSLQRPRRRQPAAQGIEHSACGNRVSASGCEAQLQHKEQPQGPRPKSSPSGRTITQPAVAAKEAGQLEVYPSSTLGRSRFPQAAVGVDERFSGETVQQQQQQGQQYRHLHLAPEVLRLLLPHAAGPGAGIEGEAADAAVLAAAAAAGGPSPLGGCCGRSVAELQAADVYSFGTLLYEILTGEPPHRTLSPERLAAAAGRLEVRWPQGGHPRLQHLACRCMAPDPAARPTFKAVVAELSVIEAALRNAKPPSTGTSAAAAAFPIVAATAPSRGPSIAAAATSAGTAATGQAAFSRSGYGTAALPTAAPAAAMVVVDVTGGLESVDGGSDSLVFQCCHPGVAPGLPTARACGAGHAFVDSTAHVTSAATTTAVVHELTGATSRDTMAFIVCNQEIEALQQQQQQQQQHSAQVQYAHQHVLEMVEQAAHASVLPYGGSHEQQLQHQHQRYDHHLERQVVQQQELLLLLYPHQPYVPYLEALQVPRQDAGQVQAGQQQQQQQQDLQLHQHVAWHTAHASTASHVAPQGAAAPGTTSSESMRLQPCSMGQEDRPCR